MFKPLWLLIKGPLFVMFALASFVPASAQDCQLHLGGKVTSAGNQAPMPYANVLIKELEKGAITDASGNYHITGLCPGQYTIVCSYIGCDHMERSFELTNNMVLDIELHEHAISIEDVVVKSKAVLAKPTQASITINESDMASGKGLNLAEALRQLPGVAVLNTGATIAKPVIQGLHSNRILLMNNGVRQEGQQWGAEHAPELDPYLANQITVVKGAAGVRYGAEAIGGVILVNPRPLPTSQGLGGEANLAAFSNGRSGVASAMLEGATRAKWGLSGRIQGTLKRGGNLQTPDYYLENTGVLERNFSWAAALKRLHWETELFYSNFYTRLGIFSGSHIGNLTDLQNAINRGRPLSDGSFSYTLARPQQRVLHELFKWRSLLKTDESGKWSLQLARQFNRRQEYDAHRLFGSLPNDYSDPDIEFELTSYTADLEWEHQPWGNWRGQLGASGILQVNTTDRGGLIPDYNSQSGGVFWIERWKNYPRPWEFELGARYDIKRLEATGRSADTMSQQLTFGNLSGTLGFIYHLSEFWTLKMTSATAWRSPNVNELFSEGVHHGSASYEKGDPRLQAERAFNTNLSIETDNLRNFKASLTLYYNLIDNFIYLAPASQPVLTIRGAFPAFYYAQADSRLMGLDWSAAWNFSKGWALESGISLLRARNQSSNEPLALMPPDRLQHGLKYSFQPLFEKAEAPFVKLSVINVLKQTRTPASGDYAPPPSAYALLQLEAGAAFRLGHQPVQIGLAAFNLLNTRYYDYLNRFRYFAAETGRNISLRLSVPFGANALLSK